MVRTVRSITDLEFLTIVPAEYHKSATVSRGPILAPSHSLLANG